MTREKETKISSREYQREEKASRTIAKRTKVAPREEPTEEDSGVRVFSYCITALDEDPAENEPWGKNKHRRPELTKGDRSHQDQKDSNPPKGAASMKKQPVYRRGSQSVNHNPLEWETYEPWREGFRALVESSLENSDSPVIPVDTREKIGGYEDSDESGGVSIIDPVREIISETDTGVTYELTPRGQQDVSRWRPDSEVDPYRAGPWRMEEQSGGKRNMREGIPEWDKSHYDASTDVVSAGETARERRQTSRGKREWRRNEVRRPYDEQRWCRLALPESVRNDLGRGGSVYDEGRSYEGVGEYVPPTRPVNLRLRRGHRALDPIKILRKNYGRAVNNVDNEDNVPQKRRGEGEGTSKRTSEGRNNDSSRLHTKDGQTPMTKVIRRPAATRSVKTEGECYRGYEPEDIKDGEEREREPHLPKWPPKSSLLALVLQTALKSVTLLLLFALLVRLTLFLLDRRPQSTPRLTMSPSPKPHDGRCKKGYRPPTRRSETFDKTALDPTNWTINPDRPTTDDVPKLTLDSLHAGEESAMTPAMVAVRHLEPLITESSLPVREFLGKAISVSTRLPNGRTVHYRGDMHLRLFTKGTDRGWDVVAAPSRADLDHLRGIMFKEGVYSETMRKLREEFESALTFEDRAIAKMEPIEEEPPAPPNTPVNQIKIGPPRKPGLLGPSGEIDDSDERGTTGKRLNRKPAEEERSQFIIKKEYPDDKVIVVKNEEDKDRDFPSEPPYKRRNRADSKIDYATVVKKSTGSSSSDRSKNEGRANGWVGGFGEYSVGTQPDLVDPQAESPENLSTSTTLTVGVKEARTKEEILAEILNTLEKLRREFGESLELEMKRTISDVEIGAGRIVEVREKKEGEKKRDGDGDVEMEKEERTANPGPHESDTPSASSSDPFKRPPTPPYVPEIEARCQRLKGELLQLEWKVTGETTKLEDRIAVLEARSAAQEIQQNEEEEGGPWTVVQSPRRRQGREGTELSSLNAKIQRVEKRVGALQGGMLIIETTMGEWNQKAKEWDYVRKRVNGLDMQVAGIEGEVMAERKKLFDLGAKVEEHRLRQDLKNREVAQGRNTLVAGLLPRVTRLESNLFEQAYRQITLEDQMVWTDQKIRAVWLANNAPATEALIHAASIRAIWSAAADAFTRRIRNAPFTTADPRTRVASLDAQNNNQQNENSDNSDPLAGRVLHVTTDENSAPPTIQSNNPFVAKRPSPAL